ncbi:MAG: hypothetical protein ACRD0G_03385 [Acidimicrobiales bacterium]
MGIRDRVRKWAASTDELDQSRLQDRFCNLGITPIADAEARRPTRLCGEVLALQVVPRAGSPWLEVTVGDGSSRAVAVFTGRTRIPGLDPGRGVVLEGVAGVEDGQLQLLNPSYTLLP